MAADAGASEPAVGAVLAPGLLGFLLGLAHRARRRAWEEDIADLELTAPQAPLLRLVAASPGTGVRRLALALGTDPMNARRISEALIAEGLCVATRDPLDARRRPLHPTAKGLELSEELSRRAEAEDRRLLGALRPDRYRTLVQALEALLAAPAWSGASRQSARPAPTARPGRDASPAGS